MISSSLETADTCILLSINLAGEVGNINSLRTKAQKDKKKSSVYRNTAAIRHLLMFYKGLPKFIKNYISLSAPFLRKGILPLYIITRTYWTGILVSTLSSRTAAFPPSCPQTEVAHCLTNGICLTNDTIKKLLQYISAVTFVFCACLFLLSVTLSLCSNIQISILLNSSSKVSHRNGLQIWI